jgi:serine/threonine protein phosphatase 1
VFGLFKSRGRRGPRIQDGSRLYVIGDVHGCLDLLEAMFGNIDAHRRSNPCQQDAAVLIGDYVDRGPASRVVLDLLVERVSSHKTILLKGNHEAYLSEFLKNPAVLRNWRRYGGLQTLISYGLKPSLNPSEGEERELACALDRVMPWTHRALLDALPLSFTVGDYFFAHAGVRPGVALEAQREEDLLWIRNDFLLCESDHGKVVVHGHTPVQEVDIRPNRINVDTGAYATGRLTCVVIEGDKVVPIESR